MGSATYYSSGSWTVPQEITSVTITACVGAGGGEGGGGTSALLGANGGAGQNLSGTYSVIPGQVISFTVGYGGAPGAYSNKPGGNGGPTTVNGFFTADYGRGGGADGLRVDGYGYPTGGGGLGGRKPGNPYGLAGAPGNGGYVTFNWTDPPPTKLYVFEC